MTRKQKQRKRKMF